MENLLVPKKKKKNSTMTPIITRISSIQFMPAYKTSVK
uniref:Uncharacterized protein n=1 Tax=Arundo donax TaxID=35708 RepID=A0A0A9FVL1_ARUDO